MKKKQIFIICVSFLITVVFAYGGQLKIEAASKAQRNIIQAALGDQYPISKIAVIRSGNHSNPNKAFYVGAVFYAEGVGNTTGIWFVLGTKESPRLVYSVDGTAHQFSGMRKANKIKVPAYYRDPEVTVLYKYLK